MESSKKMNVMLLLVIMVVGFLYGGKWAEAQVHHVVGDDRGWDLASDIASWADARIFTVGDFLWFAYSSGVDNDKVVELRSKEELETCDLSNPIMTLTQGIDRIPLEVEGSRYFASSNIETCKKGLKLPVEVKSKSTVQSTPAFRTKTNAAFLAQEPSAPSSSTRISGSIIMVVCFILFINYAL